ncbi:MAG: caspase family protein [Bacteroidota bacterium]
MTRTYSPKGLSVLLITLLVFIGDMAMAQGSWDPKKYFGIPNRDKHNVFFDEFEDNRHNWDLGSSFLTERIEDGEYYCSSRTPRTYVKHRPISMNQSGNYEIEIRLRYVNGETNSVMGLSFGRDLEGNEYTFFINPKYPKSRFKICQIDYLNRTINFQNWMSMASRYNKHSHNTLLVRKVNSTWFFFINEVLVFEMPAKKLFGSDFGFIVGGKTAVEVDYLRVSEIRTVDNMGPQITILEPPLNGKKVFIGEDPKQDIVGKVYDASGISSLYINGERLEVRDGIFRASLTLPDQQVYRIEVEAKDSYNNASAVTFSMRYKEPVQQLVYSTQQKSFYNEDFKAVKNTRGKNFLLLIGINQYSNWNRLHNAVKDCNDLAHTLTSYYQFDPENVITLFNEKATRENILETLESLQENLNPDDNLLIYYAGHGYYDPQSTLGYWVPVNARLNKIPDFIRNSTIHDYLRTINSKHTFLIVDACYAGSLFAHARGSIIPNNRSRWAFTSGDIEKVWDGQPGQNSPFARYLIRYLRSSEKPQLSAQELIENVSDIVERNTAQSPKGDPLRSVGDEGGVFMFYRRPSSYRR